MMAIRAAGTSQSSPPPAWASSVLPASSRHTQLLIAGKIRLSSQLYLVSCGAWPARASMTSSNAPTSSFQAGLLRHLELTAPDLPVPRVRATADGADCLRVQAGPLAGRVIWVTSFLPGDLLRGVRSTCQLRTQVGRSLASLGRALRGYDHPAAHRHIIWDIQHVAGLRPLAAELDDPDQRRTVLREIDRFEELTAPALSQLRGQIVHNDFSVDNVLIAPDRQSVSGMIDFGDATHTTLVNDVAVMASYQLSDDPDPTRTAIDAIAGYHTVTGLSAAEIDLLPRLITARMVTRVIVSQWRAKQSPANTRYLLRHTARA